MTITIDDIPVVTRSVPVNNDSVLYAANLAGGDTLQNYYGAKQEIAMTGDSTLVNNERAKWAQEQTQQNQSTVESIISDETVPIEQRRQVIQAYVQGAIPLQNLRDKFMVESATRDVSQTRADREAQDAYAEQVHARDAEKQKVALLSNAEQGVSFLRDFLKPAVGALPATVAAAVSELATIIPAGLAAGFELMRTQDPAHAEEVLKQIRSYAYSPSNELAEQAMDNIHSWMEVADIPFKAVADIAFNLPLEAAAAQIAGVPEKFVSGEIQPTKNPLLATAIYSIGELAGYAGVAAGTARGITALKGKPRVAPTSPLDTIETASKEQASNISAKAIADDTGKISEGLDTTKAEILNSYVLPKLEDEFGPIHPDTRVALEKIDTRLDEVAVETEFNANVYPVSQIISERDAYVAVMTEEQKPHLLLSSSVLDITPEQKLFGRGGKSYEALVESSAKELNGTAVFGRNANYGYKTQKNAEKFINKLQESTKSLPDPGVFTTLERDGQFYVQWKFKREYQPHESLAFGDDVLSAHLFSKNIDITEFANGTIGQKIFPAYMRMKEEIPTTGAAAAREEARVESVYLKEAKNTFMGTDNPKELVSSLRKGETEGKTYSITDIQMQHPHLSAEKAQKLHLEYASYRRIVDHLYVIADRSFRKNLSDKDMKALYNKEGQFVTHTTEPVALPEEVTRVWDFENKKVVPADAKLPIVRMNSPVRSGDHVVNYGIKPNSWQHGPVRAGALTQIPGYIPRYYKEWFVIDKVPKAVWIDGKKVTSADELRNHKQAVRMAGSKGEQDAIMVRLAKEDPSSIYEARKEQKDINDKIIHDSRIYDAYLQQIHKRGDALQALDRPAEVEDVLAALTKAIRSTAKIASWEDLQGVRKENFVQSYGKFTEHKFPNQITDIKPLEHMTPKEERQFLAAQSIYAQLEREQISSTGSDIAWRNGMNKIADLMEKVHVDSQVLREWGEKGFIPARMVKAFGSNLFLYWRVPRMWVIQPQQFKELMVLSSSYSKHLLEVPHIMMGLLARTEILKSLKSHADSLGRKSIKDYTQVIKALEESGITQSVDMNQVVHGIWKDAVKELDPSSPKSTLGFINKGMEGVSTAIAAPGKVMRAIGYNPAELTNQISLWLFARQRWIEKNPGKNWDTPENRATIARDQSVYGHMSSTRAGMYGWQEGLISTFTQFVAIPWKSSLQIISSPKLTGVEKAKLAGARLFWYGKAGLPLGAAIYTVLENNLEDKQDRETLAKWTESATDRIWNVTLHAMFDAGNEQTKVDTKSLSTSIDGEYIWDTINTLWEMSKGNTVDMPKITFPYESAVGSIYGAVRTIYDLFKTNDNGPLDMDTWKNAAWKAVSFAGVLSDFNKAMMVEGMSKQGNDIGYQQTTGEAVARLFGLPPSEESLLSMANLSEMKRAKEIKNTAKQIHERLISVMQAKSTAENDRNLEYINGLQSFLQTVPSYYKDELTTEILKQDRLSWKEKKESILLNIYKNKMDEHDTFYQEMRNAMEKSTDPEVKSLLKDLEDIKPRSIK